MQSSTDDKGRRKKKDKKTSRIMKLVVATLLASFPAFVFSALPPGYQDKLLCPCNFCRVPKQKPLGWVGYVLFS